MRFSTALVAAFAAGAIAGPVNVKRAYVTEVTYVTVTVTVIAGQEPTPTPAAVETYKPKPKPKTSSVPVYVAPSSVPAYVAPSSSAAPAYTPPAYSSSEEAAAPTGYEAQALYYHNVHRANHSAPDLVWNQTLANAAYSWASRCEFKHHVDGYGQNLAATLPGSSTTQISEGWYNNEVENFAPYYGIASPAVSMDTFESYGHFTQLVWKSTTSVGCVTYDCRSGSGSLKMWYTVCNYYPPGNYGCEYAANVGRPLGNPTYHSDE